MLAALATKLKGSFELAVGPEGLLSTGENIVRRDVANRAVQSDAVVVCDEFGDDAACVFERGRVVTADCVGFDCLVPPLDFAIRLRIIRRRAQLGHARDAKKLLEVFRNEVRAIVRDDPRACVGNFSRPR